MIAVVIVVKNILNTMVAIMITCYCHCCLSRCIVHVDTFTMMVTAVGLNCGYYD